jgi:hypothetical protein
MKKTGRKTGTKTGRTKLLAKHHTGKIRHHRHTSYGAVALLLLLMFIPLISASRTVSAAAEDPFSARYGTYAVVAGPVQNEAQKITFITIGMVYTTSDPIPVRGSCPSSTLVKVFKNEVLAGAGLCQSGSFQTSIDLFVGNNTLIARAYNTNDVASPDSSPITVQLNLPGVSTAGSSQLNVIGAPAGQFYVTSEIFHRGGNAGQPMPWTIIINGGQPPYAIQVSWGDGKTELLSQGAPGRLALSHTYAQPGGYRGSYTIVVKATDQVGQKSYLQLVTIISGDKKQAGVVGSVKGGYDKSAIIRTAWQISAVAVLVAAGFWLGELREAGVLSNWRGKSA